MDYGYRLALARWPRQRVLPLSEGSATRPLRRGLGRSRNRLCECRAHDGPDLGETDLGNVVDVGCAPDVYAVPLPSLCRVPAAPRHRQRPGYPGSLCGSPRHLRHVLGAIRSLQRLHVSHAAPDAHRPEAEYSVVAREHAGHVAVFGRRVHAVVRGIRDPALCTQLPAGAARGDGWGGGLGDGTCLIRCRRTAATWSRPTSWRR